MSLPKRHTGVAFIDRTIGDISCTSLYRKSQHFSCLCRFPSQDSQDIPDRAVILRLHLVQRLLVGLLELLIVYQMQVDQEWLQTSISHSAILNLRPVIRRAERSIKHVWDAAY